MSLPYDDATAARLKGDLLVKSGNSWRYADRVWVKSSGTWRSSDNVYVKSGGTWRDAAQYDVYRLSLHLMIIIMVLEVLATTIKFKKEILLATTQYKVQQTNLATPLYYHLD